MRWRGVNHVEVSVLDYDKSVEFYDRMFGWLGYASFWTLDIGYHSTYYVARFPFAHSYIGVQPAKSGERVDFGTRPVGLHHLALWAKNRREVDAFYETFLRREGVLVTDPPKEYAVYTPGYYGVFFDDPINGFHWELAHIPMLPGPGAIRRFRAAWKAEQAKRPEERLRMRSAMRKLPGRTGEGRTSATFKDR